MLHLLQATCFLLMHTSCQVEIVRCTHTLQFSRQSVQRRCQVYMGYVLSRALVYVVIMYLTLLYNLSMYCAWLCLGIRILSLSQLFIQMQMHVTLKSWEEPGDKAKCMWVCLLLTLSPSHILITIKDPSESATNTLSTCHSAPSGSCDITWSETVHTTMPTVSSSR